MDSYVGLDVSLREVSVCVVDEAGAIQSERTAFDVSTGTTVLTRSTYFA
jgi:hypothetical protein